MLSGNFPITLICIALSYIAVHYTKLPYTTRTVVGVDVLDGLGGICNHDATFPWNSVPALAQQQVALRQCEDEEDKLMCTV